MPHYMLTCTYSPGSWARLIRVADNRVEAANELMESVGGTLENTYWEVSARAVHGICLLPDSSAATAVAGVMVHTGAFKTVEVHEVLTQDQFVGVLQLAENVAQTYRVPGQAVLENDALEVDSSPSRF